MRGEPKAKRISIRSVKPIERTLEVCTVGFNENLFSKLTRFCRFVDSFYDKDNGIYEYHLRVWAVYDFNDVYNYLTEFAQQEIERETRTIA